jgi:hypothetical protein
MIDDLTKAVLHMRERADHKALGVSVPVRRTSFLYRSEIVKLPESRARHPNKVRLTVYKIKCVHARQGCDNLLALYLNQSCYTALASAPNDHSSKLAASLLSAYNLEFMEMSTDQNAKSRSPKSTPRYAFKALSRNWDSGRCRGARGNGQ